MLKRILFSVCALIALNLSAQQVGGGSVYAVDDTQHSVTFGVRAGMNVSKYTTLFADNTIGANVGVNIDIPIYRGLYAQTGLFYSLKGAKPLDDETHHIHYIHMPIMASYHYNINPSIQLQGSFGPYIAVKVGSWISSKYDSSIYHKELQELAEYYGYNDWRDNDNGEWWLTSDLKTFDAGLQFGAGVVINKIYAGLGYEIGLTNMFKDDTGVHNRNFSINVGYNF